MFLVPFLYVGLAYCDENVLPTKGARVCSVFEYLKQAREFVKFNLKISSTARHLYRHFNFALAITVYLYR